MDHLLKEWALQCGMSLSQYWHLRLIMSVSLLPLLAILYLILFDKRTRRRAARSYSLWVRSDGQLVARPGR
ncbi:hypothetical protein HHL22_20300 [Hymenobacter sp. RP-2-7]|uniref:Uncharacterized protein n=1 Tax=Hymenobacter polaris TaxID=2682546 RepID=A0A7Y0AHM1_9BACT|nr:hypothetical protein [Hymenobacter polaris]NML67549.1 hypothetical protein [Hymenobacter polaris]